MNTILTEAQWKKVGSEIKRHPGIREIVIDKDAYGNASVQFVGKEGITKKYLKGNVIEFPLQNRHKEDDEPFEGENITQDVLLWVHKWLKRMVELIEKKTLSQ